MYTIPSEFLFQSTLPRGERHISTTLFICIKLYFNPRSHEGSDYMRKQACKQINISIHAPTRGATILTKVFIDDKQFQSTLPRGERHQNFLMVKVVVLFQSTLPRGERPCHFCSYTHCIKYFNPRSHEGSDNVKIF